MGTLRVLRENAIYRLEEIHRAFDPVWPTDHQLFIAESACEAFHNIALVALLADLNPEGYAQNLVRAGENWLALLHTANKRHTPIPASANRALLGVLAVGAHALASDLAAASAGDIIPPEYEDEFYPAFFIQQFILAEGGRSPVTPGLPDVLARLEAALADVSPTRALLANALLRRDAPAVADSLATLNREFMKDMSEKAKNPATRPDEIQATRRVWIEGLAWLQLATLAGLKIEPDYDAIPALALDPPTITPRGDCVLGQSFCFEREE